MNKLKSLTKFIFVLFIFISCNPKLSYADYPNNINFKNITIENGLSQSTVETIYQDSKGYIWLGTNDGLNKYNGYTFEKYFHNIDDENSLSSNYIVDVVEDNEGFIWVSTVYGLNKIDTTSNTITNYFSGSTKGGLSNDRICEILITNDNKILVTTSDGLNIYDKDTDSFKRILGGENDLPSQYIHSITEDSYGNIWIGTDSGLAKLNSNLKKIKQFTNKEIDTISDYPIYRVYSDKDNIWVATLGSGLFCINVNTYEHTVFTSDSSDKSLPHNTVRDILRDSKDNLWITTQGGISRYNEENNTFTTSKNKLYDKNSILNDQTYCLIEDKSGLIWVGTYKGVSVFDSSNKFKHYISDPFDDNSLSSSVIHGIYDTGDYIWVGTNSAGVNVINKKNNKFYHINTKNSDLSMDVINDIVGYKNFIIIGTSDGLSILNKDTKKITNYFTEDSLVSNNIKALFIDSKNHLWIGTNRGISIMNLENNEILNINDILSKYSISDLFIKDIYESKSGNYYVGCFLDGGLIEINPNTKKVTIFKNIENDKNSITNNSIRTITEDSYGNIIIGTSLGLNILDKKNNKFTQYTTNDGLPNNTIYGALIDSNDNIWMSTNYGLCKFNPSTERCENFTIIDGLQDNEFNGKAYFKGDDGTFYFGGINGLNSFNPNKININKFTPNVIIDNFQVKGLNHDISSDNVFDYSENNISLSFFIDDFKNSKSVKYYYKLDGSHSDWTTSNTNKIVYANLGSGDYTFRIRAVSHNGAISPETNISFTIKPPFWRNDLAIFMYCLLIILCIYLTTNKVKNLDRLVENRTKELRNEMDKNEKLFNKIITLEKGKNSYFVNLSHELRTPLNVINGTTQLIRDFNRRDELPSNKIEHYMDIMSRNCNRLLNIINNIIDTSKLQSNNYVITTKEEDIVYVVEETILGLKDYIESKGIEFTIDTNVEEKYIECDRYEIERCIVNLVGNAVKFTPPGGKIDVIINDNEETVSILVKDTGIGISEKNIKTIFDKFNQVIDSNSEIKGGSGLGLTITKHLIELHNGRIDVFSEVGRGSQFVITLPATSKNI